MSINRKELLKIVAELILFKYFIRSDINNVYRVLLNREIFIQSNYVFTLLVGNDFRHVTESS